MSDASTVPGKKRNADPEARLNNDVAHALWLASMGSDLPKDPDIRRAAWKDAKKAQKQMARSLMKRLAKKGVSLSRGDVSDPEADAEADEADA